MIQNKQSVPLKIVIYVVCIFLALLSVMPFWIMLVNATRSTVEIQQHAVALLPSTHFFDNLKLLLGKSFNPFRGFMNSLIVSVGATALAIYFSSLTAYAQVAYEWRLKRPFFIIILALKVIPAQITMIGLYQMV